MSADDTRERANVSSRSPNEYHRI